MWFSILLAVRSKMDWIIGKILMIIQLDPVVCLIYTLHTTLFQQDRIKSKGIIHVVPYNVCYGVIM